MLSFPGKLRLALGVPQHHLGEIQTKATSPLPSVWVRLTGQFPDFRRREHDSVRTQSRDSLAYRNDVFGPSKGQVILQGAGIYSN